MDVLVWVLPFIFVFMIGGLYYWVGGGLVEVYFDFFLGVIGRMVGGSRLGFLGGSRLMVSRLFLLLLFVGIGGLVPYVPNVRANGGFVFIMGLCFWLGMLLSR